MQRNICLKNDGLLRPIQEKYNKISDQEVKDLLAKNAKYVNEISEKKSKIFMIK